MEKEMFYMLVLCLISTFDIIQVSTESIHNLLGKPDLQFVPYLDEDGGDGGIRILNGDSVNNQTSVFSPNKTEVEFRCTASYPVRWYISGYVEPSEFVKIQPYQRLLVNKTAAIYSLKLFIWFNPVEMETEVASSALISCIRVDNPAILSSIAVFVPGSKRLVNNGGMTNLQDTSLIPCATTDPTVPVNIYKKSQIRRQDLLSKSSANYNYDPVQGFQFPELVEGQFTCISGNSGTDSISFEVKVTRSAVNGFDYFPRTKSIKVFTNDPILLNCSSISGTQTVGISLNPDNLIVEWISNTRVNKALKVTSKKNESGTIKCIQGDQRNIWTWEYTFVDPPELFLDTFEGEVDCLSHHENKSVSTVRCRNPSDCQFMKHCFANASLCNFKRQKQFYSDLKNVWCQAGPCASVPYSHLNGIVQCTVDGLKRYWEFFVSLDFIRHYNWKNVPQNELIRMDEVDEILYTNNTAIFFCAATGYLFSDSIAFSIEYENGTSEFLSDSLYTNPGQEDRRKIDEFNVLGELKINLTLETVAIHCHAPWWNSTDFMTVQRRFITKHLLYPKIQPTRSQETFIIGETNRRLTCLGDGEPKPNYSWYKDGKIIDETSNLKISTGSKWESILEFPSVLESEKGGYRCEVNNSVGRASYEFFVKTEEEGVSTKTVVYGTTVGVILLVLLLVVGILGVVFQQYRKAKEQLRGLTDNEIEEFFKGKPEFLDPYQQRLDMDTMDLLPYDLEYEIDLENIDFDSSNVLGTGEFSYVVKGMIKSPPKDVAVKIAKSSADVTLFKSLLSEVKIMIYIGKHDNIVALVGVSTRNIKNRSIHIVMELCDSGSLEKHLRMHRKYFSNLIDQNQKINLALTKDDAKVTTLDLIRWSEQISNGMEYLSVKSIVHADLAARNVLLNNNGIAKISDFGLSKKLYECNNYVKKTKSPLPWRWMALESLTTLSFSSDSDIWSLGVTLWEIFTLGDIPFPNESWNKDFITRLASGMRMGRPKFSTPEIYSKIVACWDDDAAFRPSFKTLRIFFYDLYVSFLSRDVEPDKSHEIDLPPIAEATVVDKTPPQEPLVEEVEVQVSPPMYLNMDNQPQTSYANYDPEGEALYANMP